MSFLIFRPPVDGRVTGEATLRKILLNVGNVKINIRIAVSKCHNYE